MRDLDKSATLRLVQRYHRDARIRPPESVRRLHAVFHVIVENQLAMNDEPLIRALPDLGVSHPS